MQANDDILEGDSSAFAGWGDEQDETVLTLEDIGWTEALSKFTGIDRDAFTELAPYVSDDSEIADIKKLDDAVGKALQRMHQRQGDSHKCPMETGMVAHIKQLGVQRFHLIRRRAILLRRRTMDNVGTDDFLREHRRAFECSDAQRIFRTLDILANMNSLQAPGSHKGTQWFLS